VKQQQNAIDRLSGRVALAVVSVGVLFVILAGWFLMVAPKLSRAADLDVKTFDAQNELISTQRFLHSSAGRKSVLELKQLTRAVPSDPRMPELLRQLSRASSVAGVKIDGITPGPMVSSTGGQAIPLTVTVEGHYFRLQKFLHVLRSAAVVSADSVHVSGRLLAVDSIQFASGSTNSAGGQGKGVITATLIVNGFVSTPGATPAAGQTSTSSTTTTTDSTSTTSP
jgi:Tfp pilus assembly protein PilO